MWALPAAFAFHGQIGRSRIAGRIRELNSRIKEGLAAVPGVRLLTPRDTRLSAGLVAFEVAGHTTEDVVHRLAARRIIASASPYKPTYPRLAGSLLNTPEEVDLAVRAVRELGAAS
jgi:isopenicillin-N epimerase